MIRNFPDCDFVWNNTGMGIQMGMKKRGAPERIIKDESGELRSKL